MPLSNSYELPPTIDVQTGIITREIVNRRTGKVVGFTQIVPYTPEARRRLQAVEDAVKAKRNRSVFCRIVNAIRCAPPE